MTRLRMVAGAMVLVVGVAGAWALTHRPGGGGPPRVRPSVSAPAPSQPANPPTPFAVGVIQTVMTDPSRGVPARGPTPAADVRALNVTIRYPIDGPAGADERHDVPATPGPRPLLLFAHGFELSDQTYPRLLHDLAAAGFVVANPEFPLSSAALPGPPNGTDLVAQAQDMRFVADRILDTTSRPAPLVGVPFAERIAAVGHSDGGITAAGFAANQCCADPRVRVAVVLSGALGRFPGSWFTTATPATLVIHGDADEVNPLSSSEAVYAAAAPPKMFVTVRGGTHIGAFEDDATRPAVAALLADFVRAFLLDDQLAAQRLPADAQATAVLDLRAAQ